MTRLEGKLVEILNLTAEYRCGPDDPCPIAVRVGSDTISHDDVSEEIGRLLSVLVRSMTIDWDGFESAECWASAISNCRLTPFPLDAKYPQYHAEESALNDMIEAVSRFIRARIDRQVKKASD